MVRTESTPTTTTVGVTFALYKDQTGGAPLWQEVQNVALDANGHYSVLLGVNSKDGIPAELFITNEARWLGVQVEQEVEQPRVLLVSVPYALKAGDAETLGGKPASAYITTELLSPTTGSGVVQPTRTFQLGTAALSAAGLAPLVAGVGTINTVPKWTDTAGTLADSTISQVGDLVNVTSAAPELRFTASSTAIPQLSFYDGANLGGFFQYRNSGAVNPGLFRLGGWAAGSQFAIVTGGFEQVRVNAAGFMGIGTATPQSLLDVTGLSPEVRLSSTSASGLPQMSFYDNGTLGGFFQYRDAGAPNPNLFSFGGWAPGSQVALLTGGTEKLRIDASGNLLLRAGGIIFRDATVQTTAGTITGVTAGTGLTGGGTSGSVGLSANFSSVQARVTGTCSSGTAVGSIGADGSVSCNTGGGGGSLTLPFAGTGADNPPAAQGVFAVTDTKNGPANSGGPPDPSTVPSAIVGLATGTGIVAGVVGKTNSPDGVGVVGLNTAATGDDVPTVISWSLATSGKVNLFQGLANSSQAKGIDLNFAVATTRPAIDVNVGPPNTSTTVFSVDTGGNINTNGTINAVGTIHSNVSVTAPVKNFKIDDPIAPADKWLYHSSVESPDMMTIYNGVVVLDARGQALVEMPDYFEALNKDFRYQLTALGRPAPNLYIAREIKGNRFKISGGRSHGKVSWQVTGIRHDAWAQAHRTPVEQEKSAAERGKYMYPEGFGHNEQDGVTTAAPQATAGEALSGAGPHR